MNIFKRKPPKPIMVIIFVMITISLGIIFQTTFKKPRQIAAPTAKSQEVVPLTEEIAIGLPARLKIPSINIDVAIENMGLLSDGTMEIPKSTQDVGWFELGKRPGETGSAVIAGHYGLSAGKPSVFDNLNQLKAGDEIYIEDTNGKTTSFVVRESRSFDPAAFATDVFSSDDEKSHLNLITCQGSWNKDAKSYSQRLVVFSDKK